MYNVTTARSVQLGLRVRKHLKMSPPVLFILGAGPKIGLSVARVFAAKSCKIALAARSLQDGISEDKVLYLKTTDARYTPLLMSNSLLPAGPARRLKLNSSAKVRAMSRTTRLLWFASWMGEADARYIAQRRTISIETIVQ
jgi:hypothetical protein